MSRKRMISPDFHLDSKTGTLSDTAKITFIGFLNIADDTGVIKFDATEIKAMLFPYKSGNPSDVVLLPLVEELLPKGLVLWFLHDSTPYLWVRNFLKHQSIKKPSEPIIGRGFKPNKEFSNELKKKHWLETPAAALNDNSIFITDMLPHQFRTTSELLPHQGENKRGVPHQYPTGSPREGRKEGSFPTNVEKQGRKPVSVCEGTEISGSIQPETQNESLPSLENLNYLPKNFIITEADKNYFKIELGISLAELMNEIVSLDEMMSSGETNPPHEADKCRKYVLKIITDNLKKKGNYNSFTPPKLTPEDEQIMKDIKTDQILKGEKETDETNRQIEEFEKLPKDIKTNWTIKANESIQRSFEASGKEPPSPESISRLITVQATQAYFENLKLEQEREGANQ